MINLSICSDGLLYRGRTGEKQPICSQFHCFPRRNCRLYFFKWKSNWIKIDIMTRERRFAGTNILFIRRAGGWERVKKLTILLAALSGFVAEGAVTGQLWYGTGNGTPVVVGHFNAGSAIATIAITEPVGSYVSPQDTAVDPAAGYYWIVDPTTGTGSSADPTACSIIEYRLSNNAQVATLQIGDPTDEDEVEDLVVDPAKHVIYVEEWGYDLDHTGIETVSYNPTTGAMTGGFSNPTFLVSNAANLSDVRYMSLDQPDQLLYFIANDNGYDVSPWAPVNAVFVYNISAGGAPTQLSSTAQFPPGAQGTEGSSNQFNGVDPSGYITSLAVDVADNLLFFLTSGTNESMSNPQNALWYINTTGANQTATKVILPSGVALSGPNQFGGLSFDPIQRQLYLSDWDQGAVGSARILIGQLSASGHSLTSVTTNNMIVLAQTNNPDPDLVPQGTTFLVLPEPVLASSATFSEGGAAVTLSPSMSISNPSGGYLIGATVAITTGLLSGDTLAATVSGTSIAASYASGTGILTLTNYDTAAHYQQVLRTVNYVTANANPDNSGADTSRTLTWTLYDGEPNIPAGAANTASTTIQVYQAPAITSVNSATFLVGSNSSFTVTASGYPAPTLSVSNTDVLPSGVSFVSGTGKLSGTPAAGTGGLYTLHFSATNLAGTNTQSFTLTVLSPAEVVCPANIVSNAVAGYCPSSLVSFSATDSGYPAPTVIYTLNASVITSPHTFPVGVSTVTSTAANSSGTNSCSFTVTINPGPPPQLTAMQEGSNVVISWPSSYTCYSLQISTNLSQNSWMNYAGVLATNGGRVLATNNTPATSVFFRLKD
jgi:hypothetical protein